ncbi:hypothetical protein MPH_01153 [Macrophomina phaseolina MS6]|uniref:Uncharacterized protein n=1 Tax=Macrophomina phaseolina (strain MS6) TaxID=1126212 RepID=K2SGM2_MACPH|nr:hypothetical protein MPH_01153 [Macrophomina phaseolina MS6]
MRSPGVGPLGGVIVALLKARAGSSSRRFAQLEEAGSGSEHEWRGQACSGDGRVQPVQRRLDISFEDLLALFYEENLTETRGALEFDGLFGIKWSVGPGEEGLNGAEDERERRQLKRGQTERLKIHRARDCAENQQVCTILGALAKLSALVYPIFLPSLL